MPKRTAFTLIELLVVIAIIAILVGLLIPAVMAVREAARRTQCSNHLKQIQLGVLNYQDAYLAIPATRISFPYYQDMGWLVTILPYVEQHSLYDEYHAHKRIFDTDHESVLNAVVPVFYCPASEGPGQLEDIADQVFFH